MKKKFNEGSGTLSIAKKEGDIDTDELSEKQKFAVLIEAYKIQNPAKYELKKAELKAKLNSL